MAATEAGLLRRRQRTSEKAGRKTRDGKHEYRRGGGGDPSGDVNEYVNHDGRDDARSRGKGATKTKKAYRGGGDGDAADEKRRRTSADKEVMGCCGAKRRGKT